MLANELVVFLYSGSSLVRIAIGSYEGERVLTGWPM